MAANYMLDRVDSKMIKVIMALSSILGQPMYYVKIVQVQILMKIMSYVWLILNLLKVLW